MKVVFLIEIIQSFCLEEAQVERVSKCFAKVYYCNILVCCLSGRNMMVGILMHTDVEALVGARKFSRVETGRGYSSDPKISKCPAHGLKPKVRIELNRTFVRFKEFKAHVRLSSVAH